MKKELRKTSGKFGEFGKFGNKYRFLIACQDDLCIYVAGLKYISEAQQCDQLL